MSLDRWIPLSINRSPRSLFDPSWEVGDDFWDDEFRRHLPSYDFYRRPYGATSSGSYRNQSSSSGSSSMQSNQYQLERKMANMEQDMDRMFSNISNLYQLTPRHEMAPLRPRYDLLVLFNCAAVHEPLLSPTSSTSFGSGCSAATI